MSHKGRVRIISEDGTIAHTQLLDGESGENLDLRAYKVVLVGDVSTEDEPRMWKGELYTYLPLFNVLVDAEIFSVCRFCKQTLPDEWQNEDTPIAEEARSIREMRAQQKKPLHIALDFHHDIERVRGKFSSLLIDPDTFPLGYAIDIIEQYEGAIMTFLGESNDEGKEA